MKKFFLILLKVGISLGLIAYLVWDATQGDGQGNAFANFRDQAKDWWLLTAAWAVATTAVLLTFFRWWCLVRALEIPCRFGDALRIGFWGFLFNLAPLGIVGGDLVKAVMLAHEQRGYRAKAVASVVVDRLLGLYLLFIVASAAILLTGFWKTPVPEIRFICKLTFALTGLGAVGIGLMFTPGVTDGKLSRALGRLPRIGHVFKNLIDAVRMYRRRPGILLVASLISVCVHCLFATEIYLIARGLPGDVLSWSSHFVISPLSAATGVLPLPLGPFELVLEFLYTHVAQSGVFILKGQGLVVALCFRLINVLIAALGVYYYFRGRREVTDAIHENKAEAENPLAAN